jgi:hypothetical protein
MIQRYIVVILLAGAISGCSTGSAQGLPKLWALRPVGDASGDGDDVGPPIPVQVKRYRETGATMGFTGMSWGQACPEDPGNATPVYDFSAVERSSFFFPDLENLAVIGIWCDWAKEVRKTDPERYERLADHFVRSLVTHCNRLGIRFFSVAGNEYNLLNTTNWANMYVDMARHIYPSVKAVSEDNIVLAGNLSAGYEEAIQRLYDAGFKDYFDVMDIHCYSNHPRTGVSIEQVIITYETMAKNGDGHKMIYLGEGWGPGRSLPGVTRERREDPVTEAEIQGMRDFVVNGFRNLNTPKPGFNPDWILGASFFTLNDNMGGMYWRDRAEPIRDRDGNIVAYNLDGYRFPDWESLAPKFYNGGIVDFYGEPKGDLVEDFPPEVPPISFRGWVLGPNGETLEAVPEWERLPQEVLAEDRVTVEVMLANGGGEPIDIRSVKLSLKGKDVPSMAIAPDVQDLVVAPEVRGLLVRPEGPVTKSVLGPGERATRRFTVEFPDSAGGKSFTLLGECDLGWKGKDYYWDCWVPVQVLAKLEVAVKPARLFVTSANRETTVWLSARNNTDATMEVTAAVKAPQGVRAAVPEKAWTVPPGSSDRRQVMVSTGPALGPGRYPLWFTINGETHTTVVDRVLDVPRAKGKVVIDGNLEEWNHAPAVKPGPAAEYDPGSTKPESDEDLSATARFLWDDEALYAAFDVTDDVFWQEALGMDVWRGDSVQVGFDTALNAPPAAGGYDQDDYEYTFAKAADGVTVARYHGPLGHGPGLMESLRVAVERGENRTVYEIAIPWSELEPLAPKADARFGLSILINDADGYGRKYIEWAGGIAAAKNPGMFLPLRLAGEGR